MIKALSAIAIAAFIAAALTVLPGFAPQVELVAVPAPMPLLIFKATLTTLTWPLPVVLTPPL